jgi:hypothetical protein
LDLFGAVGAMRGKDVTGLFKDAYAEDPDSALRIMFWARDVRMGAGERKLFRDVLPLINYGNIDLEKFYDLIVELGRWDDLFSLLELEDHKAPLTAYLVKHLNAGHGLLAKWTPRKGLVFNTIRRAMGVDPKTLRQKLVSLSNTVEQKMCAKDWASINYSSVPSVASARYQRAFGRNDQERYADYLARLTKGDTTVKINAGAVYPYDIIKSVRSGNKTAADAQWKALPDFVAGSDARMLTVVDVSGSMTCPAGGNPSITCMDVAISLGLYLSERSAGAFKDMFVTFSENPALQKLTGTSLAERCNQLSRADWGMTTNLEKVFSTLLKFATTYKVPADQMPTHLLIMSDMQFNSCVRNHNATLMENIRKQYEAAGYAQPAVIFWQLNATPGKNPVQLTEANTALVSGFSPSLIGSILNAKAVTPMDIMIDTISKDRYTVPYDANDVRSLSIEMSTELV